MRQRGWRVHGENCASADANFPAAAVAASTVDGMIRADGIDIPTLLAAILKLMPLDAAVEKPCGAVVVQSSLACAFEGAALTTPCSPPQH